MAVPSDVVPVEPEPRLKKGGVWPNCTRGDLMCSEEDILYDGTKQVLLWSSEIGEILREGTIKKGFMVVPPLMRYLFQLQDISAVLP